MEDEFFDHSADPCAFIVESATALDDVIEQSKKLAKKSDVIIAIKEKKDVEKRLLPSYINAYLRYKEDAMHSNSLSLETLMFVAGTMNIGNAIEEIAANNKRFILFSSKRSLAQSLIKKCRIKKIKEIKLVLDADAASEVAMTAIKDDK